MELNVNPRGTNNCSASSFQELYKRAEEMARMPETLGAISPEETRKIFHELCLRQVELEMQNDALRKNETRLNELNELQRLLLSPGSVEHKLKLVTEAVVRLLDADFARIWMIK